MSIRNFRDRYRALEQTADTVAEHVPVVQDWPLPDGGRLVETAFGHTVVADTSFHGSDISLARDQMAQARITRDVNSTIFVDTETTGLAGGTGTHVFLVGLGRFEGDAFTVRQFFLRHPGEERALLDAIEREVRAANCVVTYNGRTFDIPMLETRFRMHHHVCEFPEQHLDLLYPARSLWKHRLPSCSLGTIERDVLGVTRVDDAPGWMIPQLYFNYLQSRRVETLRDVFNHNRQDIVSLARLAGLIHSFHAGHSSPDHPTDRLGLALAQLRNGYSGDALATIVTYCNSPLVPAVLRLRAVRTASTCLKRARRYQEAITLWETCLSDPSRVVRMLATEELAKHFEHRSHDHRAALELARKAADGARLVGDTEMLASFEHRIARLESKLYRQGQNGNDLHEMESV